MDKHNAKQVHVWLDKELLHRAKEAVFYELYPNISELVRYSIVKELDRHKDVIADYRSDYGQSRDLIYEPYDEQTTTNDETNEILIVPARLAGKDGIWVKANTPDAEIERIQWENNYVPGPGYEYINEDGTPK